MAAPLAPTPALQTQRLSLSSFTRVSKGLSVVLVGGYLLTLLVPSLITYLALLPGRTVPFAWNLLTCGFLETSIVSLLIDVTALLFLGRLLEPVWGTKEFVRFTVATSASTALLTFVWVFVWYCLTLQGVLLYTPISGFHGVVSGMCVALKQTLPEQELPLPAPLNLRVKWVPSILVLVVLLRATILHQGVFYAPFVVFGAYSAWVYLRLYQPRGEGGLLGDPSDEFAFATFFPEPLRPVVLRVETVLGRLCCGRRQAAQGEGEGVGANANLPGSHPVEASRRRERGARALEERLNKASDATEAPVGDKPTAVRRTASKGELIEAAEDSAVSKV